LLSAEETAMNPKDLDRIRFVTGHFRDLQGLSGAVPVGLMMLSAGLALIQDTPMSLLLALVASASLVLACPVAGSYYRKRFGEVEPRPTKLPVRLHLAEILPLGLFLLPGIYRFLPTVQSEYLLFGLMFLCGWLQLEHRLEQAYYLVLGGLLLGLAAPGGPVALLLPALGRRGFPFLLFGAACVLAGLLDHRLLVRTLGSLEASTLDSASTVEDHR
jgi:hypothetical protein